jgi:putative endonuclease
MVSQDRPADGRTQDQPRPTQGRRTAAQQTGEVAEDLVGRALRGAGWEILGRRVRVGRAEIDLLGIDPGPPRALVAVEVRWRSDRSFGLPEETVDSRKLARLWGAIARLLEIGATPDGRPALGLQARVDVVAVEPGPGGAPPRLRHHRAVGRADGRAAGDARTLW